MNRFIGNKEFYKNVLMIALPIMAQQFITTFVNLIDNIMIGSVGNIALTSVTVANQYYIIYNSALFGVCGAAGIYIAQYFGANDKDKCQKAFNINLMLGIIFALIFSAVLFIMPETIIRLFTNTDSIIASSMSYIKYIRFMYIPFAVTMVCMMSLRPVRITRVQLKIGILAVCTNTFFNYCLIFGNFGFPQLGVEGAAIATLIARILEMCLYLIVLARKKHFFHLDIKGLFHPDKMILNHIIHKSIPLTLNELLFSIGSTMIFKSYMRTDEYMVAAISVVDTVSNILYVFFGGLSSAVAVMIGNRLGANQLEEARDNARKLIVFGVMIATTIGFITMCAAPFIPEFYALADDIKSVIVILIRIKAFTVIFHAVNVCTFFILRAGGDTVSTLLMDSGCLWILQVLVSTLLSMYTNISLLVLFIIVESANAIKLFFAFYFFKKGHWVKNIT